MNELLARAGSVFLAAPEAAPARRAVAPPAPRFAALIAQAEDMPAAAGGVAASLRRGPRARTAVVCRPGEPPVPRPATRPAASLARRLGQRELPAAAAGALCLVGLPSDVTDAVRTAWRLTAAVDVPVLLALPGRVDGYDPLLAEADRLYLAAPAAAGELLTTLALDSLARLGPPAQVVVAPATAIARRAAALGLRRIDLAERPAQAPA